MCTVSPGLLDEAFAHGCKTMEVSELSPPQRLAVESLVHGKDVLVCLPTGSGKSMIFQILPSVCCYLSSKGVSGFPSDPIIVVASPLLALMRNQVAAMKRKQQSAALVGENPACDQQIRDGLVTFIYGSPEESGVEGPVEDIPISKTSDCFCGR